MKFFTDCSGECCVCVCGTGCLAGHGDDDYSPATKDQLIERLDLGKYKSHENTMKDALRNWYGYDYDLMKSPSPNRILYEIVSGKIADAHHYTYIICGRSGPTGKTWLRNSLIGCGFYAIEISEDIIGLVEYRDDKNHVIINSMNRSVLIVLNKPLNRD